MTWRLSRNLDCVVRSLVPTDDQDAFSPSRSSTPLRVGVYDEGGLRLSVTTDEAGVVINIR